ncbi:MAG: CAP domain-containing protein [Acidimicrobiales bacterium]
MGFRKLIALVAATVLFVFVAPLPNLNSSAGAQAGEEQAFLDALNQTRNDLGLPALILHDELTSLSRLWAEEMAAEGEIFHANPISENLTANWLKLGENVGVGPEVGALMDAFIASPGHYENIIDAEFTHYGVGVVWDGDIMFTTHRFMKLADVSAATPTTSVPDPDDLAAQPTSTPTQASPPGGGPTSPPASEERIAVLVSALANR